MKRYRSILAFGFAALVLISGSSFMVGLHFCGGKVKNIALFTQAEGCEMEKLPPCHRHRTKSCCEDKTVIHEGQDFKNPATEITFYSPVTEVVAVAIPLGEIVHAQAKKSGYEYYDPPLPTRDLTISLQIFLI